MKKIKYSKPNVVINKLSNINILMKSQDNFVDPWEDWFGNGYNLNDAGGTTGQRQGDVNDGGDIWGHD